MAVRGTTVVLMTFAIVTQTHLPLWSDHWYQTGYIWYWNGPDTKLGQTQTYLCRINDIYLRKVYFTNLVFNHSNSVVQALKTVEFQPQLLCYNLSSLAPTTNLCSCTASGTNIPHSFMHLWTYRWLLIVLCYSIFVMAVDITHMCDVYVLLLSEASLQAEGFFVKVE